MAKKTRSELAQKLYDASCRIAANSLSVDPMVGEAMRVLEDYGQHELATRLSEFAESAETGTITQRLVAYMSCRNWIIGVADTVDLYSEHLEIVNCAPSAA